MTFNYVNSFSSVSGSTACNFDNNYYRIRAFLERYGYYVTGNRAHDLMIYQEVIASGLFDTYEIEKEEEDDEKKSVPWADFMKKIGLIATGDVDKDKEAMIEELTERINGTSDEDELEYYYDLMNQVNYEFVEDTSEPSFYDSSDYSLACQIQSDLYRILYLSY